MIVRLQFGLSFVEKKDGLHRAAMVGRTSAGWHAIGFITPKGNATLDDILDDHGHAVLIEDAGLLAAIWAARDFVKADYAPNKCPCKDVGSAYPSIRDNGRKDGARS